MELSVTKDGDRTRFELHGVIDELGAEKLKKRFLELETATIREAAFDFKGVEHIGSAGIGKLLLIYKALAEGGGSLKIENLSGSIFNLFKELNLDTIFVIDR